ncbi:MAG: DUF1499 domain-containing protein [Planctomycetota bacterium]
MKLSKRPRTVFTVFLTIISGAAVGALGLLLLSITAPRPENLGVKNGRLAACPSSPNCVSTQAEDREHWIAPIMIPASTVNPIDVLADIVRTMPRTVTVERNSDYLRVEFRSRMFRFCDDVEFYYERSSSRIHFRSASRVGYSDLGVNRTRMEEIRENFLKAFPAKPAARAGSPVIPSRPDALAAAR